MNGKRLINAVTLLGLLFALTSCAHVISANVRQSAHEDLTLSTVSKNPDAYKGETVIWGGRILETTRTDNATFIKVLQMPVDYSGKPGEEQKSEGSFVVKADSSLDTALYGQGRFITVAGEITGKEVQGMETARYNAPVIRVREIHAFTELPVYTGVYWSYPYYSYPSCGAPYNC